MVQVKPKDLSKFLTKKVDLASEKTLKKWKKPAAKLAKKEVNKYIDKGISPVAQKGKYKAYSPKYANRIGKSRTPVDLKGSGRMRKSLVARTIKKGISLFYTSPIAKYHQGKGRVDRYMLPTESGQNFRRDIKNKLSTLYVKLFKI